MSPTKYALQVTRAQRRIAARGADVTFSRGGSRGTYNDSDGTWSDPVPPTTATGVAIQEPGDPDRFAALSLVLIDPVTLKVAASGLAYAPKSGDSFGWAGETYTARAVEPFAPDGTPIFYSVVGSR